MDEFQLASEERETGALQRSHAGDGRRSGMIENSDPHRLESGRRVVVEDHTVFAEPPPAWRVDLCPNVVERASSNDELLRRGDTCLAM